MAQITSFVGLDVHANRVEGVKVDAVDETSWSPFSMIRSRTRGGTKQ